ncbi:MAG: lysylphosphatidylglycerol synthase domain-containing protein [Actinomycetota bacterium]|nr:lysylphosphatidylglycerol synthase domain-containing protein [Actinomycetota bacterium]
MASRPTRASLLRSRAGIVQWVSLVAAVGFVAWILSTRGDDLKAAFALTPTLFALISASAMATFIVNGVELQVLAKRFDRHIPFGEAMLLGLLVSTLNYLPMKTGTLLNGVLMKARYKISLGHFGALVAGSSVIHLWVALGCAGTALLWTGHEPALAWALLLVPTAVIAVLVVWGRRRSLGKYDDHASKWVRALWRVVDGIAMIYSSWRLLAIEVVINVVLVMLASVRTMWSFDALSTSAGFGVSVVVTAIGIFAARLSVIPGGIGFKEGGAAAGAAVAGLEPSLGLAASVVDRAVTLVWLLLLGVPAAWYLMRITGVHLADATSRTAAADDAEEGA